MMANGVVHAFSVIFVALLSEFGLNRAIFSGVFSLHILVVFSGGAFVGPLLDRFGPRVIIPSGSVLIGIGLLACSQISSPYQLYLSYGLITSLGTCGASWLPNTTIITNWFVRRRGMAVGIVMCGSGMAMMVFIPLTQLMVERIGWRGAFLGIAVIAVLWLAPMNALFQRTRPEDMGLLPDGGDSESGQRQEDQGRAVVSTPRLWTLSQAIRQRSFWMMCLAIFCNPLATYTIVLHQVALVVGRGFQPMYVSSLLGFIGISAMAGRIVCGTLSDRIRRELAYTIFMIPAAMAIVLLFFLNQERGWILPLYVVLLGLGMGVGGAMFPPMIADLFPGPSLGRIMGITAVFGGFGAAFGSWFAGYMHDITGSYSWALLCILMAIAGAVTFVWIAGPSRARRR